MMTKRGSGETKTWNVGLVLRVEKMMMMRTEWLEVRPDGAGAGRPKPGAWRGRRKKADTRRSRPPCSPCQLRRQSERRERPEGGRGGCTGNRRGPDTSSESSAVKKVADGISARKHQLRRPGSEAAIATTAPAPAGHHQLAGSFRLPVAISPGNSGAGGRKLRLPQAPPASSCPIRLRGPASLAPRQRGVLPAPSTSAGLWPRRAPDRDLNFISALGT